MLEEMKSIKKVEEKQTGQEVKDEEGQVYKAF